MARVVTWGDAKPEQTSNQSNDFLKFEIGKEYRIRFIAKPVEFIKGFQPFQYIAPEPDDNGNVPLNPIVAAGHPEPKKAFSAIVIDRSCGLLKIIDLPKKILEAINTYISANGSDAHDPKLAPDFFIKCYSAGKKFNGKDVKEYSCMAVQGPKPLTQEEIAYIKGEKGYARINKTMMRFRTPNTTQELEVMLAAFNETGQVESANEALKAYRASQNNSGTAQNESFVQPQVQQKPVIKAPPAATASTPKTSVVKPSSDEVGW